MSNLVDYTVKRFPLLAEFQRTIDMLCEFEADILGAEVTTTAKSWAHNMRVEALLDGDEVVEIVINVRPKEESK